jgi:hypothetical protein
MVVVIASSLSQASLPEHAGWYTRLAQRRCTDPGALGPRRGDLHERVFELGEAGCLVDLCELAVDVETLPEQFDLADRRRFLGDPLLDLGTPLLQVGAAARRHLRRPQSSQLGGDRGRFGSPPAAFGRAIRITPRHRCPSVGWRDVYHRGGTFRRRRLPRPVHEDGGHGPPYLAADRHSAVPAVPDRHLPSPAWVARRMLLLHPQMLPAPTMRGDGA